MSYQINIDYDPHLEAAVLGIFLAEPNAFGSTFGMLNEDCFHIHYHRQTYEITKQLFDKGAPIDLITVTREYFDRKITEVDGYPTAYYLTQLVSGVVSSAHLEYWCIKLRELAARRLMIAVTSSGFGDEDVLIGARDIEEKLKKVLDVRVSNDWMDSSQVAMKLLKRMEQTKSGEVPGIPTQFPTINRVNGGFRPGNLIILAARPSVGKSACAGDTAVYVAKAGYHVGIITLEMENEDVMARLLSAESGTDFYKIDRNEIYEEVQRKKVMDSLSRLSSLPIYFSDKAQVNIHDIRAKADKLMRKRRLDLLIVDYLQLIEPDKGKSTNREQEVAKMSRGLKLMAMTMKIPVIVLAQLNRDASDKKPELHHLRESGSIEQDADVVMFLHRDYMLGKTTDASGNSTENQADLLVRKWRNGSPFELPLQFHKETMKFSERGQMTMDDYKVDNPRAGFANYNPNQSFEPNRSEPF